MAIERVRTLTALTIHFATQDIIDKDDTVIVNRGQFKSAHVEYMTGFAEAGVMFPGTSKRETASVRDLESIPEINDKVVDSLVRLVGQKQVVEQQAAAAIAAKDAEIRALKAASKEK